MDRIILVASGNAFKSFALSNGVQTYIDVLNAQTLFQLIVIYGPIKRGVGSNGYIVQVHRALSMPATSTIKSFLTNGSPPVILILSIPWSTIISTQFT